MFGSADSILWTRVLLSLCIYIPGALPLSKITSWGITIKAQHFENLMSRHGCTCNMNTEANHIIGPHMQYFFFFFWWKFHFYDFQHRIPIGGDLCFPQFFFKSLPAIPAVYQKRAPKAFCLKPRKSARIWITFQQYFRNLLPLYRILSRNRKSVAIQQNITCKIYTPTFKE